MQIFELLTQTALPTHNQYIQKHPKVGCIRIILLELATSRDRRKLEKKKNQKKMIGINGASNKTYKIFDIREYLKKIKLFLNAHQSYFKLGNHINHSFKCNAFL